MKVNSTNMPNFLIIGAAKSGTTALYQYLKQHPQIYMCPVKEPQFFAFEGEKLDFRGPGITINEIAVTDTKSYCKLFDGVSNEVAIGEASTTYLPTSRASKRIKYHIPDAKLIAVLRNPVDRAYAAFMHAVRDGREPITNFDEALQAEEDRIKNNWGFLWRYQSLGFYSEQIRSYFDSFKQGQIKVYIYDDFTNSPSKVLQNIFQFLEVDDKFVPNIAAKYNVSGIPRNRKLHEFLRKPTPVKSVVKSLPIPVRQRIKVYIIDRNLAPKLQLFPKIRGQLISVFREDILKLQEIIQKDLSGWLNL